MAQPPHPPERPIALPRKHKTGLSASAGAGAREDGGAFGLLKRGASAVHGVGGTMAGLKGWRHALVATGAGALGVLGMAPFYFIPALCLSLVVLLWLMDGCAHRSPGEALRRGFWTGWFYSFGYLFFGLQWIGHAFLVNAEVFAWLLPAAVTLLPAGLAFFAAFALAAAGRFWTLLPWRVLLLAAAWTLAEWVRGHVLTGFPWNLMGLVWVGHLEVAQVASVIGSYGLSFLTVAALSSVALLAAPSDFGRVRPWMITAGLAGIVALTAVAGGWRLSGAATDEPVAGVKLRIVQPGTRQKERRDPARRPEIWRRLVDLTRDARAAGVTHVIWPEAAPPYILPREPVLKDEIAALLDPNMHLLTGTIRAEEVEGGAYRYYNGFAVLDHQGAVQSTYDKHHLVPFGEYLPLRGVLSLLGLRKVADEVGALTPGPGPQTLMVDGAPPFSPVICYEIIFPGSVTPAHDRPGWIVNVTDDDWFGKSIGPRQHLSMVRMRAIEENLPVARSANSGVSALVDRFGRVREQLDLDIVGVIDQPLPAAGPTTLYARIGDWPVLILSMAAFAWAVMRRRRFW